MAAKNFNKVLIAKIGTVYIAPVGTTLPTNIPTVLAPLDVAFKSIGLINAPGPKLNPTLKENTTEFALGDGDMSWGEHKGWTLDLDLAQVLDADTLAIVFGVTGDSEGRYFAGKVLPEVACYLEFNRGGKEIGLCIGKMRLTSKGGLEFLASEKTTVATTWSIEDSEDLNGSPFVYFNGPVA